MKTVLVVDDNRQISELYKSILDSSDLICYVANSGKECMKILCDYADNNDKGIDMVLLDLAMPEMDGISLLKKLRADPKINGTKIVVITALSLPDGESHEIKEKYGVLSVVRKPIAKGELLQIIDGH